MKKGTTRKTTQKRKKVTVQELKKHEKKYTYLFVGVFIALILYIGYSVLTVPENDFMSKVGGTSTIVNGKSEYVNSKSIVITSDLVTLEELDIMTNDAGKRTTPHIVKIQNNMTQATTYRIKLVTDSYLEKKCGCGSNYSSAVWFAVGGEEKKLSDCTDSVVYEGAIDANDSEEIWFNLWFDENLPMKENTHFHGKFEIEY